MERGRRQAAVLVLGCLLATMVPHLSPAAADGHEPRIAFTDDRTELALARVVRTPPDTSPASEVVDPDTEVFSGFGSPTPLSGVTDHEGQPTVRLGTPGSAAPDPVAFVSTESDDPEGPDDPGTLDNPAGDIYVGVVADVEAGLDTEVLDRLPVTCDNDATEIHPQLDVDLDQVVYASDIVTPASPEGDFELYLAERTAGDPPDEPVGGTCEGWVGHQLTDNDADDLWPSWVSGDTIVYSSTRDDPLGDIWALTVDDGEVLEDVQQTEGPAAETQPVGMAFAGSWYVFTTTGFRPDGSLAVVARRAEDGDPFGTVGSLWGTSVIPSGHQQSSEAAHAPGSRYLAFTSTEDDPYGDVWITGLELNEGPSGEPGTVTSTGRSYPVAAEPGVAESHPTWRNVFDDDPDDDPPVIARPPPFGASTSLGRSLGRPAETAVFLPAFAPPAGVQEDEYAELVVTRRAHDADISDVVAADGADRTVRIRREVIEDGLPVQLDEAGPAYSPDGTRTAFSSDLECCSDGRELLLADADGSNVVSLSTTTGRADADLDVDPVFSPDGNRIAFTRYRFAPGTEEWLAPEVWVVDDFDGPDPDAYPLTVPRDDLPWVFHDTDPSWSPNGDFVVVSRAIDVGGEFSGPQVAQLVVLAADGSGRHAQLALTFECAGDGCSALPAGRSPAWSPDGTEIAYDDRAALRIVEVDPAGPTDEQLALFQWPVGSARAVTGFHDAPGPGNTFEQNGEATGSRPVISVAEEPAWSPDGAEIAFTGQPAGHPDRRGIWAIAPDGTGLRTVSDELGPETEPAWDPRRPADVGVAVAVAGSPAQVDGPVTVTFTITNHGPGPAFDTTLAPTFTAGAATSATAPPPGCAADGSGCTLPVLGAGASTVYVVTLSHPAPVAGTATGTVVTASHDPDPANDQASAPYAVEAGPPAPQADLSVAVELDEETGYVGGTRSATVTVTNSGPDPAVASRLRIRYPDMVADDPADPLPCTSDVPPCDLGVLAAGEVRVLEVEMPLDVDGVGRVVARVATSTTDPEPDNNRARARLEVLQPTIRLLPAVARPGMVVLAYAENMPPGTQVRLRWNRGITIHPGPHPVAADGTVRAALLIVRRDRLGERRLVARSVTDEFSPVRADLLVVLRLMTAPTLLGRG